MIGTRRKARNLALQVLYEVDSTGHKVEEVLNHLLAEETLPPESLGFINEIIEGAIKNKARIDGHIQKLAPAWPLEQISAVDRNILRLAIFEILIDNKVPVKVVINEAVELAKTFGSDSSPRFVNGVLGSVSTIASR